MVHLRSHILIARLLDKSTFICKYNFQDFYFNPGQILDVIRITYLSMPIGVIKIMLP